MPTKSFRLAVLFLAMLNSLSVLGEHYNNDEYSYNTVNNSSNEISEKSFSWLKGAQNMFASPAGHVVVQVAKELLNRSTGNSQVRSEVVLSLNLTNLLIILLLKVLIFAAGVLGAGHWNGYGYGYNYARSIDGNDNDASFGLSNGEDSLITTFLAAQGTGLDDCFYAAACANPQISHKYAKAARALMEGINKFEGNPFDNPRYNDLITLMEEASQNGFHGVPCNTTMKCDGLF